MNETKGLAPNTARETDRLSGPRGNASIGCSETGAILDAMDFGIAIVEKDGTISMVNAAWRQFAMDGNAGDECRWGVGANYYQPLSGDDEDFLVAEEAHAGLRAVQEGKRTFFQLDYPCHTPSQKRWFFMQVKPVAEHPGRVVVCHIDITGRKEKESLLNRKTEEQRLLLDTIDTQIWYLTDTETYGMLNRAHADFLGVNVKQVAHKKLEAFLSKEVSGVCKASNVEVYEKRRPVCTEEWVPNADGEACLIAITKTPKLAADGGVEFVVCAGTDITARRRAEESLKESVSNFRRFFESMGDLVVVASTTGRILLTNQAARDKLGYSEEELSDMHLLDWHRPEDREEAAAIFAAMQKGERSTCPLPLMTKDGTVIPVETRAWPGKWSGVACIYGVCRDLSAEQEARQRFARLFYNNPSPMALSVLPHNQFYDVNDAFVRTTGYPREEVVGKTSAELGLFVNMEKQSQVADRLRCQGRIANMELQIRRKDGALRDGLFWGETISSQGRHYFLTTMLDITRRKRLEAEKHVMLHRLRQMEKHESIARMAGAVAHLFNNRLMVVIGNIELAELDMPPNASLARSLREARQSALKAAEISRLMLTFLGQSKMKATPVDLSRFCRDHLDKLRARESDALRMVVELSAPGPVIQADPDQLQQVLDVLITNAFEALEGFNGVRLAAATANATDIPKANRFPLDWQPSAETYAALVVADSGHGMDATTIDSLFEPFFSKKFLGRGLGLPVALGVVRAHGGAITVESRPGLGSTFQVFLPLYPGDHG